MKNRLLYLGIALSVIGIIGRLYAAGYTHVDADGILQDSFWLPLGSFLLITGVLMMAGAGVRKLTHLH